MFDLTDKKFWDRRWSVKQRKRNWLLCSRKIIGIFRKILKYVPRLWQGHLYVLASKK